MPFTGFSSGGFTGGLAAPVAIPPRLANPTFMAPPARGVYAPAPFAGTPGVYGTSVTPWAMPAAGRFGGGFGSGVSGFGVPKGGGGMGGSASAYAKPAKPAGPAPYDPNADPGVIMARNAAASRAAQNKANLDKSRKAALIRYGIDPKNTAVLGQLGFGLDANDLAAAEANFTAGNAVTARLAQGNTLARQAILNQLAAHGMLGSGDTGYRETQQGQAYGQQQYDALNQLEDYLNQVQQQYLAEQAAEQQMIDQALYAAYQTQLSQQAYAAQQQPTSPFGPVSK